MSTPSARAGKSAGEELPLSLTDRVLARVTKESDAQGLQESASLKRVFRDLGVSYREYRRQTGEPVAPAVREAAYKFRADPTLTSLVSVAGVLEELEILTC